MAYDGGTDGGGVVVVVVVVEARFALLFLLHPGSADETLFVVLDVVA